MCLIYCLLMYYYNLINTDTDACIYMRIKWIAYCDMWRKNNIILNNI